EAHYPPVGIIVRQGSQRLSGAYCPNVHQPLMDANSKWSNIIRVTGAVSLVQREWIAGHGCGRRHIDLIQAAIKQVHHKEIFLVVGKGKAAQAHFADLTDRIGIVEPAVVRRCTHTIEFIRRLRVGINTSVNCPECGSDSSRSVNPVNRPWTARAEACMAL